MSRAAAPGINGNRLAQALAGLAGAAGNRAVAHALRAPTPSSARLQRALAVGGIDYTAKLNAMPTPDVATVVEEVVKRINAEAWGALTQDEQNRIQAHEAAIKKQLRLWIEDPAGQSGRHPIYGRKRQDRHYASALDLARGLLGWVEAKPGRHVEKTLATDVTQNAALGLFLDHLLARIAVKIQFLPDPASSALARPVSPALRDQIVQELTVGKAQVTKAGVTEDKDIGHYRAYMESLAGKPGAPQMTFGGNFMKVLVDPKSFSIWEKIVVLHDLMEYFGEPRKWVTPGAGAKLVPDIQAGSRETHATTEVDPTGARTATGYTTSRGQVAGHSSTRDETEASTQFARKMRLPIWAGSSYTTVRMLLLGRWAGATTSELAALAWGIFAFWRLVYDHTSAMAYHTLHEVMDMAQNFGVAYDVRAPGAGLASFGLPRVRAEVEATWLKLRADRAALSGRAGQALGESGITAAMKAYDAQIVSLLRTSNAIWQDIDPGKSPALTAVADGLRRIGQQLAEGIRVYDLLWVVVEREIAARAQAAEAAQAAPPAAPAHPAVRDVEMVPAPGL